MSDIFRVVLFLFWINFLPPLASLIWKESFARPLDCGLRWIDGQPLFGAHKTIRGILAAIGGGSLVAPLVGLNWRVAAVAAALGMCGDLLTSFIKRRLHYENGKTVVVLDQFFEGLFPALYLASVLALTGQQVLAVLIIFVPCTILGSFCWRYITYHPPPGDSRIIRSSVRPRGWRACHQPLARWHIWFNFPNFIWYRLLLTWFFKTTGLYEQGQRNGLAVRLRQETFVFPSLPPAFDNFRILFLSDLHLDGVPGLTDALIAAVRDLEVDLCLIGGDVRMEVYGPVAPSLRHLRRLLAHINSRHGIYGVLGNHDCIEIVPDFEEAGMLMLINDSQPIERDGDTIWIAGLDDPHYYRMHDLGMAFWRVPAEAFSILVAHSPEAYWEAAAYRPQLYLCGHTHGGQICLAKDRPLYTNCRAPRFTAAGRWQYQGMQGYTSCGAGASGVPLRFHCPGEICLFTLKRGE